MTKIAIELIPRSSWGKNVRSAVSAYEWNKIRTKVKNKAKWLCSICQASGSVHAHEVWSFDLQTKVQKLQDIICICETCHLVKHFGYARISGKEQEATQQLLTLNKWNNLELENHIDSAYDLWRERNNVTWRLDLSNLYKFK